MTLSHFDVQEPASHRRPPPNKQLVIAAAGLSLTTLYFWGLASTLYLDGTLPLNGLLLIVVLFVLFLQSFLLYRLLAELRTWPSLTDPLDAFFYHSRVGSGLLLSLCAPWCVLAAYGLLFATLLAAEVAAHWGEPRGRKTSELAAKLATLSRPLELLLSLIVVTAPLAMVAGIWWVCHTALRAVLRVLREDTMTARRGRYAGLPLGMDELRPEERRFRREVRAGMRWGGRASLFIHALPR